jgi:hypothetical protein
MLVAIGIAFVAFTSTRATAQEFTEPERLLFLSNHFAETEPQKINYRYDYHTGRPDAYKDEVSVDVLERHSDGTASVTTEFLTGAHHLTIPALEQAQGNPAILGFLESDIAEMKRMTGGSTAYFRKSIRMAFASAGAQVVNTTILYNGHPIKGQEIVVRPYVNDPNKARMGDYADKLYVFVMSDAVPGKLYSIYTKIAPTSPSSDTSLTIAPGVSPQ